MDSISEWLRRYGLEKYAAVFSENAIDFDVLGDLEREDFKDLGIPIGDIRRLLRAIGEMGQAPPAPAPEEPAPKPVENDAPSAVPEAERRQLTIMFADLIGSTELSQQLDPEDLRDINRTYQQAATAAIESFGGFVARYMGDGVLAYFGYPQAHEDDAERSVRAGRSLIEAVRGMDLPVKLSVRVGIATGAVVVGDLIGEGASRENAVVGETPNRAARLQSIAEPDSLIIGDRTRRLAAGAFVYRDLGELSLKGLSRVTRAWEVVGESVTASRFEALRGDELGHFIGRDAELGLLMERWEQVLSGEGQAVLVSGEAGIGKSRITRAFRERLSETDYVWVQHQCTPHHTMSALYPFASQLERASRFEANDPAPLKFQKLQALLEGQGLSRHDETVPVLAALLSIPTESDFPSLSAQERKARTFEALTGQLEELAGARPTVWVFEDAHWADPTSRELIEHIVDRIQGFRALAIITARPEYEPAWTALGHTGVVPLTRLSRVHGQTLVENLTGGRLLPVVVLDQIMAKTDGVPLYVEELTKAVLESDLLREHADRYELVGPFQSVVLPSTLQDSLMARLDRLSEAKQVAQTAAAIGREFRRDLLARVMQDAASLDQSLEELVAAGLIYRRGVTPVERFVFKHALVQDAALESMLRRTRQSVHERIAAVLESDFPNVVGNEPEVLAHHCREAGEIERAIRYWERAGRQAAQRSAYVEAAGHLSDALELLQTLPRSASRFETELTLQTLLGPALMAVHGFASDAVERAYSRARELCEITGRSDQLAQIVYGLFRLSLLRANLERAYALAMELWAGVQGGEDRGALITAHRSIGNSALWLGRCAEALEHLLEGAALYDARPDRTLALRYGDDPGVDCLSYAALSQWWLGDFESARTTRIRSLELARELSHPFSLARALGMSCMVAWSMRDPDTVVQDAEEMLALSTQHGLPIWKSFGEMMLGSAKTLFGDAESGDALFNHGLDDFQRTGARLGLAYFRSFIVDAHVRDGHPEAGRQALEAAMAAEAHTPFWQAELYRLKGEVGAGTQAPDQDVEAAFHEALSMSREHGARGPELRAANSLARFWMARGKVPEATRLLSGVLAPFADGSDVPDLVDARRLLNELSPSNAGRATRA